MLAPVVGHDAVFDRFRRAVRRGRLASTFLFVGAPGIGKYATALRIAQALLCESAPAGELYACGHCEGCRLADAGTHPDLIVVTRPPDSNVLPIDLFIGDREHRMQVGLCHDIALKPMRGGRKVAIIDDADYFNQEAANCLLKTLEEPPPRSVLILIGTSVQRQLPTIRSRCQIVRFDPLARELVAQILVEKGLVPGPTEAGDLAARSDGSLRRALEMADPALREFRHRLFEQIAKQTATNVDFVKEFAGFVEAAGREAPPRRERLKLVIGTATDLYRELMMRLSGASGSSEDELLERTVLALRDHWAGGSEGAASCLERCLEAEAQVDANANLANLIECWLDDLSQITTFGYLV